MVKDSKTKIYRVGSRHTIYLQKDLVNDSAFPFKPNEAITIKIEDGGLSIEKSLESEKKDNPHKGKKK